MLLKPKKKKQKKNLVLLVTELPYTVLSDT